MTIDMYQMREVVHSIEVPKDAPLLTHVVVNREDFFRLGRPEAIRMGDAFADGVLGVDVDADLEPGHARVEYRPDVLS